MRFLLLVLSVFALAAAPVSAGGALPKGPPWHRSFVEAHAEAAKTGKPIFVYFTKFY